MTLFEVGTVSTRVAFVLRFAEVQPILQLFSPPGRSPRLYIRVTTRISFHPRAPTSINQESILSGRSIYV